MEEKVFTLYWIGLDNPELVFGTNIVDAFIKAGYGSGALSALDLYTEGDTIIDYEYTKKEKCWHLKHS